MFSSSFNDVFPRCFLLPVALQVQRRTPKPAVKNRVHGACFGQGRLRPSRLAPGAPR